MVTFMPTTYKIKRILACCSFSCNKKYPYTPVGEDTYEKTVTNFFDKSGFACKEYLEGLEKRNQKLCKKAVEII
uniref:Uncharacterized protein n=1 Tax=Romanomermis culicivorax TaxID=13658 RepID=A0A915IRL9_ROMCU